MDKRSVLVDALAHLRNILQQTQIEENRINGISTTADVAPEDPGHAIVAPMAPDPLTVPGPSNSALFPAITE
ncbi:hypothetical protein MKW94_015713, partial [Papaver nudicaule]|nr:hypothetical protein [Papaver nudicaule]